MIRFDDFGEEPLPPDMTCQATFCVIGNSKHTHYPLHDFREGLPWRRLQGQVVMIPHDRKILDPEFIFLPGPHQHGQEQFFHDTAVEYQFPSIGAGTNMVAGAVL